MPILSNVVFSAYCACHICCGPDASGITAAGTAPKGNYTIAGPRAFPLGSRVSARMGERTFYFKLEDRTALKWDGKRWDIYFHDHEAAKRFGIQRGTVTILTTTPTKGKKKK